MYPPSNSKSNVPDPDGAIRGNEDLPKDPSQGEKDEVHEDTKKCTSNSIDAMMKLFDEEEGDPRQKEMEEDTPRREDVLVDGEEEIEDLFDEVDGSDVTPSPEDQRDVGPSPIEKECMECENEVQEEKPQKDAKEGDPEMDDSSLDTGKEAEYPSTDVEQNVSQEKDDPLYEMKMEEKLHEESQCTEIKERDPYENAVDKELPMTCTSKEKEPADTDDFFFQMEMEEKLLSETKKGGLPDVGDLFTIPEIKVESTRNTQETIPDVNDTYSYKASKEEERSEEFSEGHPPPEEGFVPTSFEEGVYPPDTSDTEPEGSIPFCFGTYEVGDQSDEALKNETSDVDGSSSSTEVREADPQQQWDIEKTAPDDTQDRTDTSSDRIRELIGDPMSEVMQIFIKMKGKKGIPEEVIDAPSKGTISPENLINKDEDSQGSLGHDDGWDRVQPSGDGSMGQVPEQANEDDPRREEIAKALVEFWKEGWIVDSLVGALEEDLEYAWSLYQMYKMNIERANYLRSRLERLNGLGHIKDVAAIEGIIADLDMTDDMEVFINALEATITEDGASTSIVDFIPINSTLSHSDARQERENGRHAYTRGAYTEAAAAFRNVISSQPEDVDALILLKSASILDDFKRSIPETPPENKMSDKEDLIHFYRSKGILYDPFGVGGETQLLKKTPEEIEAIGYNRYVNQDYWGAAFYFIRALQTKPDLDRAALRLRICQWRIASAS